MSNLDKVFQRKRVTKLGIDAMITNYLRLEKELYAAQRELVSLKTGIPVDDCNQGLGLIESKTLRLMSAYDEHEVRERLRKTTPTVKNSLKVHGARKWVGLTDDEIWTLHDSYPNPVEFARDIEAKLLEKNGG